MKQRLVLGVLMSLLLIGCVPEQQYQQKVTQNEQLMYLNDTYQQLNQNLNSEVTADQVEIKQLQNRLQVTMVNSILFPEGGWELHDQGRQELSKIVPALQGVPGKQIVIAGYTDNLLLLPPVSEHFPTNWSLSSARAISVVRYLEAQGSPRINCPRLLSVSIVRSHPMIPRMGVREIVVSASISRMKCRNPPLALPRKRTESSKWGCCLTKE
jgi:chemotaxis protein MotB